MKDRKLDKAERKRIKELRNQRKNRHENNYNEEK